jgi:hypothetical protein
MASVCIGVRSTVLIYQITPTFCCFRHINLRVPIRGAVLRQLFRQLFQRRFVAVDRLGSEWWAAPTLLAEVVDHLRLDRWLAGRVDNETTDQLSIQYADVLDNSQRPKDISWLEMSRSVFSQLYLDNVPDELIGRIIEIGVYVNPKQPGEEQTIIRLVAEVDNVEQFLLNADQTA